jgi:hypothetical protein
MKKHPVDDLFKRKLTSLEKKPSELAWERIREGQKSKSRRIAAWVWYAAASITLALISGYVVWQNQANQFSEQASNKELAKTERMISDLKIPSVSKAEIESEFSDQGSEVLPELKKSKSYNQVELVQNKPERKINKDKNQEEQIIIEVHKTTNTAPIQVAKAEPAKTETNTFTFEKPESQQSLSSEKLSDKAVELAYQEEKKPDRTIVVEVEEPKNEFVDKKPSRLTRVFRQLKNVREAEPVDWNEVGFHPKDIIARADDRPNNDDEKVSGKRERKN